MVISVLVHMGYFSTFIDCNQKVYLLLIVTFLLQMAAPVRVTLLLSCFQVSEQICRKIFVSDIFLSICNLTGKSQNFGDRTSQSATVSCKESYFLWDFVQEMIKSNLMYFVKFMFFISAWSHKHWSFTIIEVKYKFNQNLKSLKQSEANINLHECTYISPWQTRVYIH